MTDLPPEALDALVQLIQHNLEWEGLPAIDQSCYEQSAAAITALRARLAEVERERDQLEQDLSDMRDNAESAYRRGYFDRGNGA